MDAGAGPGKKFGEKRLGLALAGRLEWRDADRKCIRTAGTLTEEGGNASKLFLRPAPRT
jgi:hypothetical protein